MTYTSSSFALPPGCTFRRAVTTDARQIEQLVNSKMLNPLDLNWERFWVIENEGKLIACGQLRLHRNVQELSSLVVHDDWQKRGLGRYLAQYLIKQASASLYLSCGARLVRFYNQFGFEQIPWSRVPSPLKFEFGLSKLIAIIRRRRLAFMQCLSKNEGLC